MLDCRHILVEELEQPRWVQHDLLCRPAHTTSAALAECDADVANGGGRRRQHVFFPLSPAERPQSPADRRPRAPTTLRAMAEPLTLRGTVALADATEAFTIPVESPDGGCLIRYSYSVTPPVVISFAITTSEAAGKAHTHENADTANGECVVDSAGLQLLAWEQDQSPVTLISGLFATKATPVLTYKVTVLPSSYLELVARREMVALAESGNVAGLTASIVGPFVHAADDTGRTPLHGAATAGSAEAISVLLDRGAALEARDEHGRTPLLVACAHAHVAAVRVLVDAGADTLAVDAAGRGCLHVAASPVHSSDLAFESVAVQAEGVLRLLLVRADEMTPALRLACNDGGAPDGLPGGGTPLAFAAAAGLVGCCTAILESGVGADDPSDLSRSSGMPAGRPLLAASACGHVATVAFLIDHGADPMRESDTLGSAIHVAAARGHVGVVRLLSEQLKASEGASGRDAPAFVLRTDGAWRTPLLCAAGGGHGECVEVLVSSGSPLEQCDRDGNSPLLAACTTGDPKAVAVLMRAGARPRRRNIAGRDALCCAAAGGHLPLIPLLLPKCSDRLSDAMVAAAAAGQARTAVAIVELCPLSLLAPAADAQPPSSPSKAAALASRTSACEQLVAAIWRRCAEEQQLAQLAAAGAAPRTPSKPNARAAYTAAPTATMAAASKMVVGGEAKPAEQVEAVAATRVAIGAAAAAAAAAAVQSGEEAPTPGGLSNADGDTLDLADLTNIQELIRQELNGLDDDDDDDDDDE